MKILNLPVLTDYAALLDELKERVRSARLKAAVTVNRELVQLYWSIGRDVLQRQFREGWGAKVVDRLAVGLRSKFPDKGGFSPLSLKFMRSFAEAYSDPEFAKQLVAQLPGVITSASARNTGDEVLAILRRLAPRASGEAG